MNDQPTHLDLFSGIGGFSLAFEAEGFKTIGFSEIDPYASAILKKHWPKIPNYGDVRNIPAIRCDVITGGFPCQPFSLAGQRRGKEDDRYLWPAMLNAIERCRPTWVIGENVYGISGMALDQVLVDLEGIGYSGVPLNVPACAIGARHERKRIWFLVHSNCSGLERIHEARGRKYLQPTQEAIWRDRNPTPRVCRRTDGIPAKKDRIRCLGNAIVPQVAQVFARAIYNTLI
jgi:DNA (cytosine-5)-methyltransferase 1